MKNNICAYFDFRQVFVFNRQPICRDERVKAKLWRSFLKQCPVCIWIRKIQIELKYLVRTLAWLPVHHANFRENIHYSLGQIIVIVIMDDCAHTLSYKRLNMHVYAFRRRPIALSVGTKSFIANMKVFCTRKKFLGQKNLTQQYHLL